MKTDTIRNPEVGSEYLVRRKISGKLSTRYQPAKITARWYHEGTSMTYAGWRLNVIWLNDNTPELNVHTVDDSVRELTARWLSIEISEAAVLAEKSKNRFDRLCFLKIKMEI